MLDLQRYKSGTFRAEVHFTRTFIGVHLALGALVVLLLLLHELMSWAALAAGWYVGSIVILSAILTGYSVCRGFLSLAFIAFGITGIFFLGQVLPSLKPDHPPLLPHGLLPFWLGILNIAYLLGGIFVWRSERIAKACSTRFKLW